VRCLLLFRQANSSFNHLSPFYLSLRKKNAQVFLTAVLVFTSSLITSPMPTLGFECNVIKVLIVLSIGTGSLVVSHASDSLFWIFTQMIGTVAKTGYKVQILSTLVIGITSAFVIWVISLIVS
jgi:GntP family gluconate:H+ symporter